MRLTPLDLQNHRFSHRLRGYDSSEVDDFVRMVAEDYESLVRENGALRESVRGLELRVAELTGQEGRLRETLVTVQTLTEDLKRTSIREAEMKVAEAEVRAEKILDAAHRRAARLQEEIRELGSMRGRLASAVRATLDTHAAMLDSLLGRGDEADAAPAPEAPTEAPREDAGGWRSVPIQGMAPADPTAVVPVPA